MYYNLSMAKHSWIYFCAIASTLFLAATSSVSADDDATLKRSRTRIRGLSFEKSPVSIDTDTMNAQVKGKFERKDARLIYLSDAGQKVQKPGEFVVEVPVTSNATRFRMVAVSPDGKTEMETFEIVYPGWTSLQAKNNEPQPDKRWYFSPSLGVSSISFEQTRLAKISLISATVKLGVTYLLKPGVWDLGFASFFNAQQLSSNYAASSIRFFGANLRLGYTLPFVRGDWRLNLMGGIYYTTMMVSTGNFGYRNQLGPQFFPVLTRFLKSGDSVALYAKYSPIGSPLKMSNRELAGGLSYRSLLKNKNSLIYGVDVSQLNFTATSGAMKIFTFSGSVGYGF